jgi:CRP-like cAMP-binding protein
MKSDMEPKFKNSLLNVLSSAEYKKIENHLEKIEMIVGKVLYYPSEKIEYVYFPETSVISIVIVFEDGNTVESGIIGNEGCSGAATILSEEVSTQEATVQLSGIGHRLPIAEFHKLFEDNKEFRGAAMRHIYSYIHQISQNAACLCHHKIDQRLGRWLLMFDDRASTDNLILTQEFIAQMLGVHRPTVSKNANALQKKKFIKYNRGTVKITDREGLEEYACECYQAIRRAIDGVSNVRYFEKSADD